jgi:type II secretory pathway pseudopilin PulG
MKTPSPKHPFRNAAGFSLVELSFVMALIISLSVAMGFGITSVQKWKKGKNASLALQAVYAAQRAYMADHPIADIAAVTATQLKSYLPQGWSDIPVVAGLQDEALTLDYSVMPPQLLLGTSTYDPSGKSDDGLWDTGD